MLNLCFFAYPNLTRGRGGEDSLTENLLEPGYLEDYAVRTFFANKRFSNKGPIKFIDFRSVFGGVR